MVACGSQNKGPMTAPLSVSGHRIVARPSLPPRKVRSFTVDSEGYVLYLRRSPVLPKLGWIACVVSALLVAVTLLRLR